MRTAPTAPAVAPEELARQVRELGLREGLDAVGIAPAAPFGRARTALEERKAAGLHAGMAFTYRNPARSTTPARTVGGARAIVVGARRYPSSLPSGSSGSDPAEERAAGPTGRVARYAWTDHYRHLRESLAVIARHLKAQGHRAVVVVDDNALVDREAAYRAGIGWFGKNANLLLPGGRGSWFVLGGVITTAALPPTREVVPDGCGACHRCLDACPTGAIVAPGVIDANRCLAWLVQRPGTFPRKYREALGDRIYGCDDCQEVCPPNLRVDRDGAVPETADGEPEVDLLELLAADDAGRLARYGRWYLAGRDPRWLRRNALLALGNAADGCQPGVVGALQRYLSHPDPMLRAHAVWACRRLGRADLLTAVALDVDPAVVEELAAAPPPARGGS